MIEISLVELQLHIAAALSTHGIGAEEIEVMPDPNGAWRIVLNGGGSGHRPNFEAVKQVELDLGTRYRIHRLSLGGAYGG